MTYEQLRELRLAHPFRPFRMNLTDGRSVPIRHASQFAIHPNSTSMIVGIGGKINSLAIDQVASVTLPRTKSQKNQRSSRRATS